MGSVTGIQSPASAGTTILRHCRCMDCGHWDGRQGACRVLPFHRFIPRGALPSLLRRFWTDLGMVRPEAWHYCRHYYGPQISRDVWVWPALPAVEGDVDTTPGILREGHGFVNVGSRDQARGGIARPSARPAVEPGRLGPSARRPWPEGRTGTVLGSTGGSDGCDRGGNGSAAGLFRSTARAQGSEEAA